MSEDLVARGRAIVDANLYMVLGTADGDGRPWATPVYFAHSRYNEFLWVSEPGTRHSFNVAVRQDVSLVIFDSHAELGEGRGLYVRARADQLDDAAAADAIAVFSRRSIAQGGHEWSAGDVRAPARLRLYRAVAVERDLGILDQRHRL